MPQDQITPAIDRLFRIYYQYYVEWDEDSLFQLLTALHSLDDRLNAVHGRVMFDLPEYIALKALRNYYHHAGEVRNVLRIKSLAVAGLVTDMLFACLIDKADAEAAIANTDKKFRQSTADAVAATFKDWRTVADINPCVFNCVVKVFELLQKLRLAGSSSDFHEFKAQYEWEAENGHSHHITGTVRLHPADVTRYIELMEKLYRENI